MKPSASRLGPNGAPDRHHQLGDDDEETCRRGLVGEHEEEPSIVGIEKRDLI